LPIGDYALLSDCRSAALVSRDGSVDWLCFPRFDGPSVFCRLLDPGGGYFSIRPAGEYTSSRRYVDQTMVLETTFAARGGGVAVLTDALAVGRNERGHRLGAHSPSMLLRQLSCTAGEIEAEVSFAPRLEYGLVEPVIMPAGEFDVLTRRFLRASADTAARRWQDQDQGIWEVRGEPRDYLYSKLMCWVALDRAIALADRLGAEDRVVAWRAAKDDIRAAILARGWNERAGAFTQAFGSEELDASTSCWRSRASCRPLTRG
jgi:GH15 family glucan-1,4-alpha-glucosidase